ncbi:NAD(P)-binding protein [Xylariaceae sp. AK1471]|nr:NAD(P)-binding protein [Xylariaceae sp. AK1471]
MATRSTGHWTLPSQNGLDSLQYDANGTKSEQDLGPNDVLVELRAASLNYRDLVTTHGAIGSPMPLKIIPSLIPGSDGSGRILAIGSAVASARPDLKAGVDVVTHMVPEIADDVLPDFEAITNGLGGKSHGTLCRRGIFHYGALVPKPSSLSYAQAATLTCSGLTAWNALMGYQGREVKPGDWVLVQGTGGVSIAALQIAIAAGATVIATTSSDAKAERLRAYGASHVINYRTTPDWGEKARALTPNSRGVDHVVDVAGPMTLPESLKAVRRNGLVTLAGVVGGLTSEDKTTTDIMGAMWHICVVRGVLLGTRDMLRDMMRFVEENMIEIAMDDVEFKLEDARSAYERLKSQQHFSKVIIKMD